jgi:hypothetical protein
MPMFQITVTLHWHGVQIKAPSSIANGDRPQRTHLGTQHLRKAPSMEETRNARQTPGRHSSDF